MTTTLICSRLSWSNAAAHLGGLLLLLSLLVAGCGPQEAPATATPLPTPTPIPTPTPTPTPVPPIPLTIRWPASVSALEEVEVVVELPGLAERDPEALLWVWVTDPLYRLFWYSDLEQAEDGTYVALDLLHLPLETLPGDWQLNLLILCDAAVSGERTMHFCPESVPLQDLSGQVRAGLVLHIPQAFAAARQEGDEVAGGRVWTVAGGAVGLWWVPGPAEPLSQDTAQVMVDATLPDSEAAEVVEVEPVEWGELTGFRFTERWSEWPAETLVVQGPDRWLYLLRVRALDGEAIPPLLWAVQASFHLEEQ